MKEEMKKMSIDYHEFLYNKVSVEHDNFLAKLRQMTPEQVMEHAYEKVIKDDLVILCESEFLEQREAKALCRMQYPLDAMYQKWLDTDVSYMDRLRDCVEERAKEAVKEMKAKQRESR